MVNYFFLCILVELVDVVKIIKNIFLMKMKIVFGKVVI